MVRGHSGPHGLGVHSNGEKKKKSESDLNDFIVDRHRWQENKGTPFPNARRPSFGGRGLREANPLLTFRNRLHPFPLGDGSLTCILIFTTSRNQAFAYIRGRGGRGPAPGRSKVFHDQTLLIGFPSKAEAEPNRFALPFGLRNSQGNRRQKPQGDGEAGPQNESSHWLHCWQRVGRCSRSCCSFAR